MTEEINLDKNNEISKISIIFFVMGTLCFLFLPVIKLYYGGGHVSGIYIFIGFIPSVNKPSIDLIMWVAFPSLLLLATISILLKSTKMYKALLSGALVWLVGLFWLIENLSRNFVSFGFVGALFFLTLARFTPPNKKAEQSKDQ